jgi:uncharacterized protein
MSNSKAIVIAFAAGLIFAAGLALGGMMDPSKVRGFLDVSEIPSGRWDPSLAFVMGGALTVAFFAFRGKSINSASWVGGTYELPTTKRIDARLIVGALLFGIGWGIAGYCPGPAIANGFIGGASMLIFLAAMATGMILARIAFAK